MSTTPATSTAQGQAIYVLVIGAGIVGLFCAYFLRQARATVAVVECVGRSAARSCMLYGNTGFVGTQGSVPLAEPGATAQLLRGLLDPASPVSVRPRWDAELVLGVALQPRVQRARRQDQLRRAAGHEETEPGDPRGELCAAGSLAGSFTARGLLVACRTRQGFDRACAAVPHAVASGVPLRILDRPALRALEPDADFDVCGARTTKKGLACTFPASSPSSRECWRAWGCISVPIRTSSASRSPTARSGRCGRQAAISRRP